MATVVQQVAALAVDAFVVAGVAVPYIPQARSILASRNPAAFSLWASLIVLASATLRVFYFLVQPFEKALLFQAFVSVAAQLAMIAVVTRVAAGGAPARRTFMDHPVSAFWAWDDFRSYVQCWAAFVAAVTTVHLVATSTGAAAPGTAYASWLGVLALGIEAALPLPQAWRNYTNKSTAGLSTVLIASWFAGDAFKTVYAVGKGAPLPFIACGVAQFCIDCVILVQMTLLYPAPTGKPSLAVGARVAPPAAVVDDGSPTPPVPLHATTVDTTWEGVGGDDSSGSARAGLRRPGHGDGVVMVPTTVAPARQRSPGSQPASW